MATTEEIFHDAVALPLDVRAELTERLIASLAEDISPEITTAQLQKYGDALHRWSLEGNADS